MNPKVGQQHDTGEKSLMVHWPGSNSCKETTARHLHRWHHLMRKKQTNNREPWLYLKPYCPLRTLGTIKIISQEQWLLGIGGEEESKESMLLTHFDDDIYLDGICHREFPVLNIASSWLHSGKNRSSNKYKMSDLWPLFYVCSLHFDYFYVNIEH